MRALQFWNYGTGRLIAVSCIFFSAVVIDAKLHDKEIAMFVMVLGMPTYLVFLIVYLIVAKRLWSGGKPPKASVFAAQDPSLGFCGTGAVTPEVSMQNLTNTLIMSFVGVVAYAMLKWPAYMVAIFLILAGSRNL